MNIIAKLIILIVASSGMFALADDNPAAGSWKLNAAKTKLNGPLPAFVHDGILTISREIFTDGKAPERMPGTPSAAPHVFKFDLSSDGRVLTLTRPGTDPGLKLVFDRQ